MRLLHYLSRRTDFTAQEQVVFNRCRHLFSDIEVQLRDDVMFGAVEMRPPGLPPLPQAAAAAPAAAADDAMQDGEESGTGGRVSETRD